jgi:ATP-dependent DNA helicase RecG
MTRISSIQDFQESEILELKTGIAELEESIIDICALLNHKGGTLLFGVKPDGTLTGLTVTDTTFRKVAQKIRARIKPEITLSLNSIEKDGKTLLKVSVPEGTNKPYFADGQAYIRSGTESIRMPVDDLKRLIRQESDYHWDQLPCPDATLTDIDPAAVSRFLQLMQEGRRADIDATIPVENALQRLNLISNGMPTNAAILLFGKNPQRFMLQAEVRSARFSGTDITGGFFDMADPIQGTLLTQITEAEAFIRRHINRAVKIGTESFSRIEEWDYPLEALREAVTNALCHRDYGSSANVQIRIYDDRIEIWNPGTLPSDVTVESLKGDHISRPRNKSIARLLYLVRIIEQWGTGTSNMVTICKRYGLEEPEFTDTGSDFRVTIRRGDLTRMRAQITLLNDRQKRAFEYLKPEGSSITSTGYADLCACTDRTARSDLKKMLDLEIIIRTGESRRIRYTLQDHFRKFPEISGNPETEKSG